MLLLHPTSVPWHIRAKLTVIIVVIHIHLTCHPIFKFWSAYTGLYRQLNNHGWVYKAPFEPVKEDLHDAISRWLGFTLINNEVSLYHQIIKVTSNIKSYSLLKDFHISDETLTNIFTPLILS